jgi:hypothetical protein
MEAGRLEARFQLERLLEETSCFFQLTEQARLMFVVNAFNLFNSDAGEATSSTYVESSRFGRIGSWSIVALRRLQLGAKVQF